METTSTRQSESVFELQMDQQFLSYLLNTAKWNKLLAIVGFVISGLMILYVFLMNAGLRHLYSGTIMEMVLENMGEEFGILETIILFVMTTIYLVPNFWRYKFSVRAIKAIYNPDQALLNDSMNKLRMYSKYWGILSMLLIGFYVVVVILAILNTALTYSPTL